MERKVHWFSRFPGALIAYHAKIFYCGGSSSRLGTLRAVIPLSDLPTILCEVTPNYVGPSFPELEMDSAPCTVIEILPNEEEPDRKAGFYLIEKGPLDFEGSLRTFRKAASGSI